MDVLNLSENIIRLRHARKLTQEELADFIGVTKASVSKWENGTSDPSTSNLLALAKLYGIPAGELLNSIKSKENNSKEES